MTEFTSLPFHTQALIGLILLFILSFLLRTLVNTVGYVWAITAMPREERIRFLTEKRKLFTFKKGEDKL